MATSGTAEAEPAPSAPEQTGLDPAEQEELAGLMEVRFGGEGLADFIARIAPAEPPPPHLTPLIEVIERARREPVRVCISMPPRHAKTITILRAIAWWLARTPADTCGYFSYNSDIARSKSRIARDLARSAYVEMGDAGEALEVEMSPDKQALSEWRTSSGGGLLAGGAGGGLTGQGITGFVVVDDPIKNREEADSDLVRQKIWEWFNEVVMTRLERASAIVVHTRWHEDDLIGRLEDMGGWEVIRLPAIAEEADSLGRKPGDALWARFPASELGTEPNQRGTLRGQIGEFSFSALYQQRPRPRGAKLFGPAHYYAPFDLTGWRLVIGGDPTGSAKTSADWAVAAVLAVRGHRDQLEGRIVDLYRKQLSIPDFARVLRALQLQWSLAPIFVEAVAGFKAVPQLLIENDPQLIVKEAPVLGDKFQRAQLAAAAWNSGRLQVPLEEPSWPRKDLLHELQRFTGVKDADDDIVDAVSHAWNGAALDVPLEFQGFGRPILPRRR